MRHSIEDQVREALADVRDFVESPNFRALLLEMVSLEPAARPQFVEQIVLDEAERRIRGIVPPDGLVIQRTTFADERPTLFCVTKHLPADNPWKKVTVTFDNPSTNWG